MKRLFIILAIVAFLAYHTLASIEAPMQSAREAHFDKLELAERI